MLTDSTGAPRHDDVFSFGVASEVVLANQTYTSQTAIDIEGLRFSIRDGAGAPGANDLFRILVQSEYQGDSGIQAVEVQDNQTVQTNLPGNQVFSGASIDLITAVKSFANALTGDYDGGIGQAIADVDAAFDQVLAARGSVGALMNRLETSTDVLEATQILLAETLSAEQDADLIVLVSELALQEVAIQAAVEAGSRIFNTSLLNFLR